MTHNNGKGKRYLSYEYVTVPLSADAPIFDEPGKLRYTMYGGEVGITSAFPRTDWAVWKRGDAVPSLSAIGGGGARPDVYGAAERGVTPMVYGTDHHAGGKDGGPLDKPGDLFAQSD